MLITGILEDDYFHMIMPRGGIVGFKFLDIFDGVTLPIILPQMQVVLTIGSPFYQLNGSFRESDVIPFIDPVYDRTMLPLRLVSEALGATVTWIESTRTVLITDGGSSLSLQVDTPLPGGMGMPTIVNDRVFVPVYYVMEFFGITVEWDVDTQNVYIGF